MRRVFGTVLVVVSLAFACEVRADGLAFDGNRPLFSHVWLPLEPGQKQWLVAEARKGAKFPELRLTRAQRDALKKETGAEVPWLFAVDRKAVEGQCTCGSYNLAVVIGERLAVYSSGLGDHLSPSDLKAIEAKLRGSASADATTPAGDGHRKWTWLADDQPTSPPLAALLGRFPGGRYERSIPIPKPWQAAQVRVPALPRLGEESDQDFVNLFSEPGRIAAQPAVSERLAWPTAAARLEEADGTVTWLLPAITSPGVGPPGRAWALFEYRGKKLSAVLAIPEAGTPFGWVGEVQ